MASSSGTGFFRWRGGEDGGADAVRRGRHAANAHTDGILDRVEDRGSGGDHGLLADSFRAERSNRRRIFDENRFHRWHVAGGGNKVVMNIFPPSGKEFLHQRHAQTLRGATFDLSFDERRMYGADPL